jgi:transcriptional regulator with XRE-family HTH domain
MNALRMSGPVTVSPTSVGQAVRARRGEESLRSVARRVGLSASMLSQLERGETTPSAVNLWRIASVLDVPVTDLLVEVPYTPKPEKE